MTAFSHKRHSSSRSAQSRVWIAILVSLGILVFALAAGGYALLPQDDRIADGVSVNGVTLGGQTRAQARAAVESSLQQNTTQSITLAAASERREITLDALGVRPDIEKTLNYAYGVGRQDAVFSRLTRAIAARRHGMAVAPTFTLDRDVATGVLKEMAHVINRPSTNATAHWDDGAAQVVIIPGIKGGTLDIDESLALVVASTVGKLAAGQPVPAEVTLPYAANTPRVTAEMLAPVDTLLATFTTSYASSSRNRAGNVETAARSINGAIVMPGEVFSYNQTVGPRSAENGFRIAPVIMNGQLVPGLGGGVCQVSTTLYNAALLSNMKIVARSHHSHPVPYVPSGRDATVSYGSLDLKFRNASAAPIAIEMYIGNRRLTARILGKGPAPVVTIERSGIQRLAGRTTTKKDPHLALGARVVEQRGTGGLAVTVTRVVGAGDAAVREMISHDRYIGTPSIVRIGAGAPVAGSTGSATVSSMAGSAP